MTEDEALALLKMAASRLSGSYASHGRMAFVLVQNHDGTIDIIGPDMPADVVDDFFGAAAEGYLLAEGEHPLRAN